MGETFRRLRFSFDSGDFNTRASFSQLICALTSFSSALSGPFFLESNSFRKWMIYNTSFFLIQSFQRNIYLENHLLNENQNSRNYWSASKWIPALILFTPLITIFVLGLRFTIIDLFMVSGFLVSIIQDRYRYLHLSKTPKIAITGDFTWFVSIIFILIFGCFLFPDHLESVFILQLFVGPILGLIPLVWKSNKNHFNFRGSHGIKPLNVSYLNFLRVQFYIGSIVSFAVSTNIVRYLSVEDLKTFKIIQTFLSPYQSLGSVLYVAVYANKNEKLADFTYRNMIRLSKKLLLVQLFIATSFFLLYAIFLYQFPNHYWFFPDLQSLIVSLIGPIIMVGFIPIGAYLRRNCMGRQILLAGLSGSLSYLILLFPLHLSRTILGIFFSTSFSIAITIILNVHFAKKYAQQSQRNI